MTVKSDYFDADMGVIWVQPAGPNTIEYPILCANLDSVDAPLGDTTTRMCKAGDGKFYSTHRAQGLPGEATFTIETYLPKTQGYLQRQVARRCPMPVYLHHLHCGRPDTFLNYDHGELLENSIFTSKGKSSLIRGLADAGDGAADMSMLSFDLTAEPMPPDYWKLVTTVRSVGAEEEPLRDIWFSEDARCVGPCGTAQNDCTNGTIVADATALAQADTWYTLDGWANGTAIPSTFGVTIDIPSVTRFALDRDTVRVLTCIGTVAAAGMRVGYIDYDIPTTTWGAMVPVVVSALPAADFAVHGGALFSFDAQHIWLCTSLGYIWFSSDGGLTWTDQDAPNPAGGAEALFCIRFVDYNYGACVGGTTGASNVFMTTTDGGAHWTLGTGPAATQLLTGVAVIDQNRMWVTNEVGGLNYTNDGGNAWNIRVLASKTPNALGDVVFIDEFFGACCGNYNSTNDYGAIYRTFDGGYTWEAYIAPTEFDEALEYYGMNALWMCDGNSIFAVGEPVDLVGLIMELSPDGSV